MGRARAPERWRRAAAAPRQRTRPVVHSILESDQLEQLSGAVAGFFAGAAGRAHRDLDVLSSGKTGDEIETLEDHPYAGPAILGERGTL